MNKRGLLDFNAGVVVLVLIIYFIFFSFIVYSVASAFPSSNIDDYSSNLYNEIIAKSGLLSIEYCDSPRLRYDFEESAPYELSSANENNLRCDFTDGIMNQQLCESYDGCGWVNTTEATGWQDFICGFTLGVYCPDSGTLNTCLGYIISDNYGVPSAGNNNSRRTLRYFFMDYYNSSSEYNLLVDYLNFDATGVSYLDRTGVSSINLCTHPNVILNKTNCDMFQCTWKSIDSKDITLEQQKDNFINIIVKTLTFSYDFGFENNTASMLMNLIFVFIPFMILIVASIYAVFG